MATPIFDADFEKADAILLFAINTGAREMIARTIATERERCARIADAVAADTPDGEGEIFIASKIAKAIRAGHS